jgi:hypothetical protein
MFLAALSKLTAAIDADKVSAPVEDENADERVLGMTNRALPLIDLLAVAANADKDLMWK